MLEIAPSVLAAHPLHVARDVDRMLEAGAAMLHLDILDGHFVPNLSFGPAMVEALRKAYPGITLDVHLMLSSPGLFLDAFISAGASEITLHTEAEGDIAGMLGKIRGAGLRAGLSLKPATAAASLAPYLSLIDLVLVMSVEPGFGGQKLMMETLPKMRDLREMGFTGTLSVDGGVNRENGLQVKSYGATRLVMGTAAFRDERPSELFEALRRG